MSIKTSKRIALGVIASLVFAPFAAIAPASAGAAAGTVLTITNPVLTVTAGSAVSTTYSLAHSTVTTGDTITLTPTLTSGPPDASPDAITDQDGTAITAAGTFGLTNAGEALANSGVVTTDGVSVHTTTATTAESGAIGGTFTAVPSLPGKYVYTITPTTTGTAKTVTVYALSNTSTSNQALAISQSAPSTGATNEITVTRTVGAVSDGQILGKVTSTSDGTNMPLNTIFGINSGANEIAKISTSTAASPVFTVTRSGLAAGSYSLTFFVDANSNQQLDSGEVSVVATFNVGDATDGITISLSSSTRADVDGLRNFTVTVTVSDEDGNPTTDTIRVTETRSTGAASGTGLLNLTNIVADTQLAQVGTSNTYIGNFAVDTAPTGDYQDTYITAHIDTGVTATTDIKATAALRVVTLAELRATADGTSMSVSDVEGVGTVSATTGLRQDLEGTAATDIALTVDPAVESLTFTGTAASADAGEYIKVTVTPGGLTDDVAASTTLVPVLGDLSFTHTIAVVFEDEDTYTVTFTGASLDVAAVITFADPAPRWATSPASFKAKYGDKVSLTGTLDDQYGRPYASKAVTATVTGRNPSTSTLTTNASGQVTLEYTDTSTSTTVLVDTMTFSYVYLATAAATASTTLTSTAKTATFSSTGVVVGSIVVTEDSDNTETIDQDYVSGVPAPLTTYTATLKTSTGAPVASGVIVTFSGGADDIFYGSKVGVTDAFGQATVKVYRQKAGYATISAAAGGVTSNTSSAVLWSNDPGEIAADGSGTEGNHDARNVTVSAAQTIAPGSAATVLATVTDRFGNPVSGVLVTWSYTGVGRPITGADATVGTDTNGNAQFQVTSLATEAGAMTVRATISGGQTLNTAGYVGATEVAGVTAGNAFATSTVTFAAAATPEVVVPPVAPTLQGSLNGRVLLFGSCMADEGDMIIYVKSPGKAWNEKAKTLECAAGEFDGSIKAPKNTKYYRVKQEGTGLWSSSVLIRP